TLQRIPCHCIFRSSPALALASPLSPAGGEGQRCAGEFYYGHCPAPSAEANPPRSRTRSRPLRPHAAMSTTPRRRASARGHNGGRADQDAETIEIEDKVMAQAQEQAQKMKKVTDRSLERALARTRVAAALSLDKATKDTVHDSLSEPLIPQPTCSTNLTPAPSTTPIPAMGTDIAAATTPSVLKKDDETWNKRQITYVLVLTSTIGLVFLLQLLFPTAYARWIIMLIAAVWILGSIGLRFCLYGTSRCEMEFSRHTVSFIYTMFSVLVVYGFYLLAMSVDGTSAPTPSMSVKEDDHTFDRNADFWCTFGFGAIGLTVLLGNLWSSVRGCWTGGDRDP
ncbi:hypothetical protein U9M48_011853, partial [Paspalum notatum var. saurae]